MRSTKECIFHFLGLIFPLRIDNVITSSLNLLIICSSILILYLFNSNLILTSIGTGMLVSISVYIFNTYVEEEKIMSIYYQEFNRTVSLIEVSIWSLFNYMENFEFDKKTVRKKQCT